MYVTKEYDTSILNKSLEEEITNCLEDEFNHGIWAQKYVDNDEEYWTISFVNQGVGEDIFESIRSCGLSITKETFMESLRSENFDEAKKILKTLIESNWDENNTIYIKSYFYSDEYIAHGLNRKDFY
jgi:hypothetical protein